MKTSDIDPAEVYAIGPSRYHSRSRGIVLFTERYREVWQYRGGVRTLARYIPAIRGERTVTVAQGLPVLVCAASVEDAVPDAELRAAAATARDALRAGHLPELPEGLAVQLWRPQDVVHTWATELAEREERRRRVAEAEQRRRMRDTAESAAYERLCKLLGDDVDLPRTWVQLETLIRQGAEKTAEERAAQLRLAADGRESYVRSLERGVTRGGESDAPALQLQADTLRLAAQVVTGDQGPVMDWVPVDMWTPRMYHAGRGKPEATG